VVLNDGDDTEAGSDYINANIIMVVTDIMVMPPTQNSFIYSLIVVILGCMALYIC